VDSASSPPSGWARTIQTPGLGEPWYLVHRKIIRIEKSAHFAIPESSAPAHGSIADVVGDDRLNPVSRIWITDVSIEEHVIYEERLQGVSLDFRGRPVFLRYDCCKFVKCTILIDDTTTNLSFTACEFEDCNVNAILPNGRRSLMFGTTFLNLPLNNAKRILRAGWRRP
jgi:hypothetical protein